MHIRSTAVLGKLLSLFSHFQNWNANRYLLFISWGYYDNVQKEPGKMPIKIYFIIIIININVLENIKQKELILLCRRCGHNNTTHKWPSSWVF